jgi:murein DD-endopeptidase MepM/ murein hydrolase activator NlpD
MFANYKLQIAKLQILWLWLGAAAFAQTFVVEPPTVVQGDTLHVKSSGEAEAARLNGRTIRLYPQPDGETVGLMPAPATEPPGKYDLEFLDKHGAVLHSMPVTIRDAHFASQNIVLSKALAELQPSPGEMETVSAFHDVVSEKRYWEEPLVAPVSGCMTSAFGVKRLRNGKPTGHYHQGVDQRAPSGTPIRAVAGGVVRISRQFSLHGGTVAIDHGQGLQSIYIHMSQIAVAEGATVNQGDVIGYIGSTGRSTAPHLHWGLYVNRVPVNPTQWMRLSSCSAARRPPRRRPQKAGVASNQHSTFRIQPDQGISAINSAR